MKIKKIWTVLSLMAIMVLPLCLQAGEADEDRVALMCKGSGIHCMEVDMGNGMMAKFVKNKEGAGVEVHY